MPRNYPLHDKMSMLRTEHGTVQEFIDWLQSEGLWICELGENDRFYPTLRSNEKIIADFFDIDLDAWDAEKDEMLKEIRASYGD